MCIRDRSTTERSVGGAKWEMILKREWPSFGVHIFSYLEHLASAFGALGAGWLVWSRLACDSGRGFSP
eukprot:5505400-Prymnesium_polylepis.1